MNEAILGGPNTLSTPIGDLLERIQEIDNKILGLKKIQNDLPSRVGQLKAIVDSEHADIQKLQAQAKAYDDSKRALELDLKECQDKLKNSDERLKHVTNNNEYQACLKEKNTFEKKIQKLETDILSFIEKTELSAKEMTGFTQTYEEHLKEFETQQRDVESKINDLKTQIDKQIELRTVVETEIPPLLLTRYNRILKGAGGLAVTSVINGVCKGCQRRLAPQKINLIQKGGELFQCDNCQRFLIYK